MMTIEQEDETVSYPACPCCAGTELKHAVVYGISTVRCVSCHVSLREVDWVRLFTKDYDMSQFVSIEEHAQLADKYSELVGIVRRLTEESYGYLND